ncbi:MAG: cell division protein ZapD, partial [Betaproteobacteria bacterium HGW-Betaproteobacteria-15]
NLPGKTGLSLTENDWLMSIRSRIGIPGGTCEFDLPAYFHWQHHSVEQRQADLQRWVQTLAPLAEAVVLLLKMLRDSGSPQKVVAPGGQFQQNLPQGRTFQLLRLGINPSLGLIPEISGNRLLLSVRLMRQGDDERLHLAQEDASFELTLCA